jgi:YihY family inner membrane protein
VFTGYLWKRLYSRWNTDHVFFSAAAIAFNIMVTVLPLGLLIISLSGIALQRNAELQGGLREWIDDANPFLPEGVGSDLERVFLRQSGFTGVTGIVGLVFLLWLVSRLFGTIRTALDTIFDVPEGRHVVFGKLYDFLLAIVVSLCFVAAFVFTTAAQFVVDSPVGRFVSQWPLIGPLMTQATARLLAPSFSLLLLLVLYWAAPNRKISWGQALMASLLSMAFIWLGTELYAWTISRPDWGVVYGSLAAIMATLFWLYWLCVIFLGAAEVSQIIHEWRRYRRSLRRVEPTDA